MRKANRTAKKNTKGNVAKNVENVVAKTVEATETAREKVAEKVTGVKEVAENVKETIIKESEKVAQNAITKVSNVQLEIFETTVSLADIENAVKEDAAAKNLKGDIKIYINVEQRAAYYTVNGEGTDEHRIWLGTL